MKKLLFILLLFRSCMPAMGQDVSGDVKQIAHSVTDSLAGTLDSVVIKTRTTSTAQTLPIDTITCAGNQTFWISIGGFNPANGDDASAIRHIRIKNFNGVYSVVWTTEAHAWSTTGTEVKTSWAVPLPISGGIVIRINTVAVPTNWTYKRYSE